MKSIDEQILRATKEIVVKFIEMGRLSPSNVHESFKDTYATINETVKQNVNEETKSRRLQEIIDLQQQISYDVNQELIDTKETVLVEGSSKKSDQFFAGRTDTNKVVIFPKDDVVQEGSYVNVEISRATQATLFGEIMSTVDVNLALIA